MDIAALEQQSRAFRAHLERIKSDLAPQEFAWYPYGTLDNFHLLNRLLTGENRNFFERCGGAIADIGAADGDTAFFLESLGHAAHVIDFPPTNFNSCRGVHMLKSALNSKIEILETDLDSQFRLPAARYSLAFFLGILYHLKNPYFVLESLAKQAQYAFISTRITRFNIAQSAPETAAAQATAINRSRVEMSSVPAAYVVAPDECNNDATNFWMFTEAGLRRILDRCGWDVLDFATFGNTTDSDPASREGDERAFCFVRSRHSVV